MARKSKTSLFFLSLLLLHAAGCAPSKRQTASSLPASTGKPIRLTLVLKAEWAADSSVHFSIYNDIRNEGLLQQKNKATRSSGFLACFASESGEPKDSAYFAHPLKERVETKNGEGKILTQLFFREEAFTEVHVPYTSEIKKLILTDLETRRQQHLDIR